MMVLMTSLDPKRALSSPGIAPHSAPPAPAAITDSGSSSQPRLAGAYTPTSMAAMAPMVS